MNDKLNNFDRAWQTDTKFSEITLATQLRRNGWKPKEIADYMHISIWKVYDLTEGVEPYKSICFDLTPFQANFDGAIIKALKKLGRDTHGVPKDFGDSYNITIKGRDIHTILTLADKLHTEMNNLHIIRDDAHRDLLTYVADSSKYEVFIEKRHE